MKLVQGSSVTSVSLFQASDLLTKNAATLVEFVLDDREDVRSKKVVGVVALGVADGVSVDDSFSVDFMVDVRAVAARGLVGELDFVAWEFGKKHVSHRYRGARRDR